MRQKTFDLTEQQLARLDAEAERSGVSKGEIVRAALEMLFASRSTPYPTSAATSTAVPQEPESPGNGHQPAHQHSHQPTGAGRGGKGVRVLGRGEDSSRENSEEEEFCLTPPVDTPLRRKPARPRPRASPDPDFETFWEHYPRHVSRLAAEQAWGRCARDRPPLDALLSALSQQTAANHWTDPERLQFVPHASAWLNQRRWGDEVKVNGSAAALEPPDPWLVGIFDRYPPGPERDERILKASSGQISPADLAKANRWDELRRNGGAH